MLLIDEIDRADDDFEAFLLELLAEATVTIPEIGTIRATHPPVDRAHLEPHARPARRGQAPLPVPLDRLPEPAARGRDRAPAGQGRVATLAVQVADAVARMRDDDVQKPPGIAEAIDWLARVDLLGIEHARRGGHRPHARPVLKYGEDQEAFRAAGLEQLVAAGD